MGEWFHESTGPTRSRNSHSDFTQHCVAMGSSCLSPCRSLVPALRTKGQFAAVAPKSVLAKLTMSIRSDFASVVRLKTILPFSRFGLHGPNVSFMFFSGHMRGVIIFMDISDDFHTFLTSAKVATYAGSDDDTTLPNPLLDRSMQLEFTEGGWLYRDIYFGLSRFSGLEAVYLGGNPVWSMAYSGGMHDASDAASARELYKFLRLALRNMPRDFPVRGPLSFREDAFSYQMDFKGDLATFSGEERILIGLDAKYSLTFSGGMIL